MDTYVPKGFVSVDQKSDFQIAADNLQHCLEIEKIKAWTEGYEAAMKTALQVVKPYER